MLKPQDIVTLLKVHSWGPVGDWTYSTLAIDLGMSASSVYEALKRASSAGLYDADNKKVKKHALLEFLVHGLRYVFYAHPGPVSRGIPTAHSAEPLKSLLVVDVLDVYVWPTSTGELRGQALAPLYRSVPFAAQKDPELYVLLSLIDAIRVGRVREQRFAAKELSQRLTVAQ